jgi:hypothetical protein
VGSGAISGPSIQRSRAGASTRSMLSHPVSARLAARPHGALLLLHVYYSARYAKALSRLGKGLELRKLEAEAGFEPATPGL